MDGISRQKAMIRKVSEEIKTAKGFHRKDLIRYRNRLCKELKEAETWKKGNRNEVFS